MALKLPNLSSIPNIDDDEDSDIEIIENPGPLQKDCTNDIYSKTSSDVKDDDSIAQDIILCKGPIIQLCQSSNNNLISNITVPIKNENLSNKKLPTFRKEERLLSKPKVTKTIIKKKFNPDSLKSIRCQLKGIIFSGWVHEREYLDLLKAYRDKIEVDEWEFNLNRSLKAITYNISGVKEGNRWIGMTVPSDDSPCFCLWVLLDSAPYPGHYWHQITDVLLDDKYGLQLSIHTLRKIHQFDGETSEQREKRMKGDISVDEWKDWLLSMGEINMNSISSNALSILNPSSIGKGFRLVVVLLVTLIVALLACLRESWRYMLLFMREFGIFIHHATPFLQSMIQFGEKIVGGFYLLIAMVYKDVRKPNVDRAGNQMAIGSGRIANPRPTYIAPEAWVYKNE